MNEMTNSCSDLNKGRNPNPVKALKCLFLTIVLATIHSSCTYLQPISLDYDENTELRSPDNLDKMVLLEGYGRISHQGIDTIVGEITKNGGLTIRYGIGELSGNFVDQCGNQIECLWKRTQSFGDHDVVIALTNDRTMIATFPDLHANFFAKVENEEQIAEFLLMVLTYP